MPKWYEERGNSSDVVISTKVRLSRNVKKYPFSTKMSDNEAKALVEELTKVCIESDILEGETISCNIHEMNEMNRIALEERQILSNAMTEKTQYSSILMREDESAEIMLNEEDHIRIQTISSGMNIVETYQKASLIDDKLSDAFEIAYDEKYGYLTASPVNLGTGLRVSYMLFLPALSAAGKINTLVTEVAKYGVTLRGLLGDEEQNYGDIYMVSNQRTLGCSEQEILENLNSLVTQIIKQERVRREYVLARNYNVIEEQVYRSYGILKYTKQIDERDAITLLSRIMFGADTGIIKFQEEGNLYQMIMNVQSNVLQAKAGKSMGSLSRERYRADYINRNLPKIANSEEV